MTTSHRLPRIQPSEPPTMRQRTNTQPESSYVSTPIDLNNLRVKYDYNDNYGPLNAWKLENNYKPGHADPPLKKQFSVDFQKPKPSFWDRFSEFADINYHGFVFFFKAQNAALKVFWAVVVAVFTAVAIYLTTNVVSSYFSAARVSKITYVPSRNISHPVITVCDESSTYFLNKTRLDMDGVSDEAVQLMLLSAPVWFTSRADVPDRYVTSLASAVDFKAKLEEEFGGKVEAVRGFFMRYGAQCEAVFHSCRNAKYQRINCCRIFRPIMNFRHGLCFASDFKARITAAGLFSSVFIRFNRLYDLWMPPNRRSYVPSTEQNLELFIRSGISQGMWHSEVLVISAGEWSLVRVSVQRIQHETSRNSDHLCVQSAALSFFQDYSFTTCMWERGLLRHKKFTLPDNCVLPMVFLTKLGLDFDELDKKTLKTYAELLSSDGRALTAPARTRTTRADRTTAGDGHPELPQSSGSGNISLLTTFAATISPHTTMVSEATEPSNRTTPTTTTVMTTTATASTSTTTEQPGVGGTNNEFCTPKQILGYVFNFTEIPSFTSGQFETIAYWMEKLDMGAEDVCLPPCDRWIYKYSEHGSFIEDNTKNTSGLSVMIIDYEYPLVKDVPALEWYEYISFIGGVWGLWVGTSIMTVVQIFYTCALIAWKRWNKRR